MLKNTFFIIFFFSASTLLKVSAQEAQIFKVEDFDLKGNVKSCLVVTKYGKEEFEFDEAGRLIKSVTRYSDTDYDITRYKFEEDELIEKRTENYRDGVFEPAISFGNFYTIEQTNPRLVTEKVFSYEKKFLDSYQYTYNDEGDLISIIHSGDAGENETKIEYIKKANVLEQIYILNGVIKKSIKTTFDKVAHTKTEITNQYIDGVRTAAVEKIFGKDSKLLAETKFNFDVKTDKLIPQSTKNYSYVQSGVKNKVITKQGATERLQQYIYQFDNEETGNWVKEIITPDNLYTTRRIEYFSQEPDEKVEKPE